MSWSFRVSVLRTWRSAISFSCLCTLLGALNACDDQTVNPKPEDPRGVVDARVDPPISSREGGAPSVPYVDAGFAMDAGEDQRDGRMPAAHDASRTDNGLATDAALDGAAPPIERSTGFAVGTRRIELMGNSGRVLPVQLWYPAADVAAAEAETGHSIDEFEAPGARRALLHKLVEDAREDCPNLTMHAAIDAAAYARSAPFPLLVSSHHFNGSRFSMFTIAEALARKGMVVAAPDHVNGSLFERKDVLTDSATQFSAAFLQTRVGDLRRLLDVLLDAKAEVVPADLRGHLDAERVGALGHSMGGITVGIFSVEDTRVRASLYHAIIPSPANLRGLFGLPSPTQFRTPALYLSAQEDGAVEAMGGSAELAANYEDQPPPAFWIDVRDAGHFSFADDCGLVPEFDEGCGTGQRVTNGESFTYLGPEQAREIAADYSAAFFAMQFLRAPVADLTEPRPPSLITVKQHGGDAGP
ncbi:MAG: uncharacterized protein JWN48_889 [Myxococcaceae bacterium]|nr:uncharacterized protein [Myxococcaceae bacterium]